MSAAAGGAERVARAAGWSPRPSWRAVSAWLAVLVSVFLLVWFGRKVTGDLTRLHGSVRAMAEERLPRVVERLRRGEDVDVLAESPPPAASSIREISQIASVVRHRAGGGRRGRGRAGAAAQGDQPGLPEHLHAQPVPAAPAAGHAGRDGAPDQRPGRAGRPLPPRPSHHPHAQARGGPDHLVGVHARPRLARSGSRRRRAARRDRRGRGLRPGRRGQRVARPGGGDRGQRHHPPGRGAGRERHRLLPAEHQDRGQGGPGGHRPGRGGRGPRARPVPRGARPTSTGGSPTRPSSTWPTASSWACSWSARWPPGTRSRSRSAGPPTGARRPSSCCRSA